MVTTLRITIHFFPTATRAIVSRGPGGVKEARVIASRPLPGVDAASTPTELFRALERAWSDPTDEC